MSDLVGNPEDRFSHNEAHLKSALTSKTIDGSGDGAESYFNNMIDRGLLCVQSNAIRLDHIGTTKVQITLTLTGQGLCLFSLLGLYMYKIVVVVFLFKTLHRNAANNLQVLSSLPQNVVPFLSLP